MKSLIMAVLLTISSAALAGSPGDHEITFEYNRTSLDSCQWFVIISMDGMQNISEVPKDVSCNPNLNIRWEKPKNKSNADTGKAQKAQQDRINDIIDR